jgi:hypothetical protein
MTKDEIKEMKECKERLDSLWKSEEFQVFLNDFIEEKYNIQWNLAGDDWSIGLNMDYFKGAS